MHYKQCPWSVYESISYEELYSALQRLLLRMLKRSLGEHEMSWSGPWGTSAVSKGPHSGVKSQPLRGRPQREDMVKCGHLRTEGVKELADVRKLALFIIRPIVVCFAYDLYICDAYVVKSNYTTWYFYWKEDSY